MRVTIPSSSEVDEAQEYTVDQESALKYIVTDSMNPQTIFCGTPTTAVSSGTVFSTLRRNCLQGNTENTGWAEWSVPTMSDCKDKELWYETNPSLGTVFTERSIGDEIGGDEQDFNIQRLGLWVTFNLKSVVSKNDWLEVEVGKLPKFSGNIYAGVKFGRDGLNVALSVAVKTTDGKIFVECIDCRPVKAGFDWLADAIVKINPETVLIDGANGQQILKEELAQRGYKRGVMLPAVAQIITANARFEQALFNKSIIHMEQPSVLQIVSNCDKRAIGTSGGFGYCAIRDGMEIAIMDSIILAHYICEETKNKPKKKQSIGY